MATVVNRAVYRAVIEAAHGYWWPIGNRKEQARRKSRIRQAQRAARLIADHVPARRVCIQAGGHVGLWPEKLAPYFDTVYTFEPDYANWLSLSRNVAAPNVYAARGVLGDTYRGATITRDRPFSGVHYVVPDVAGPIPTYRIDDLGLAVVDAILLDVEGAELPALRGARSMIAQHRPMILVEDLNWGARLGYGTIDEIRAFLEPLGYQEVDAFLPRDRVFQVPVSCAS